MVKNQKEEVYGDDEEDVPMVKVLVLGGPRTGKTSIINRYCHNKIPSNYKVTVGVDCVSKITVVNGVKVELFFWDISGQERYAHMTRQYFENAKGVFIVFDVSDEKTLEAAEAWKAEVDNCFPNEPIPSILLANKSDKILDLKEVPYRRYDQFCEYNKIVKWFLTSAMAGTGLDESVDELVKLIFDSNADLAPKKPVGFKLTSAPQQQATTETRKTCC
ncbi:Rab GTPase [Heterostelium album PN500]|uniref:Rab GTPase n=1 Tax=Heterostelium pallidum (strain ATCC 26659 / Pp 5 / PN500) TaxID=670386 RepID=D3BKB0_HETP5|nr:Rab GTPase [Heterostelium album PN500]EFA78340.1 Rab GTPase [Heterostelium album PN500]|eukprot:XP_020430465.1 Rab GTPase [Heterostelium album PN500]